LSHGLRIPVIALLLLAVLAAAWFLADRMSGPAAGSDGLNVLLVTLDTTRADALACYGNETVKTPNIDALAGAGVLFEQCTTSAPITLPAHATLMTATEPFVHGARTNGVPMADEGNVTLAEVFSGAGYGTAAVTAAFVVNSQFGLDQGFAFYENVENTAAPAAAGPGRGRDAGGDSFSAAWAHLCQYSERRGDAVADSAIAWLRNRTRGAKSAGENFFLWVHFYDPHEPANPPPRFKSLYENPYLGEVAFMDEQVGRVLDALEQLGLDANTLVVVAGDHGEGLGQHGEDTHTCFLYDTTLSVPLILRAPGILPEGKRIVEQVRLVDVAPTILDAAGLPPMERAQGISLLPLVGGDGAPALAAYSETMIPRYDFKLAHLRSLRLNGWKYIHAPRPELYRVTDDPDESADVAAGNPELVERMRALLRSMIANAPPSARPQEGAALGSADRERLMALGYMGGTGDGSGDLSELDLFEALGGDPKDHAQGLRLLTLGMAAMRDSRHTMAVDLFAQASSLHPGWTVPSELRAVTLSQQGRTGEAIEILRHVLEKDPENSGTHLRLAMFYDRENDRDGARRHYNEAVRLDPSILDALRWLARDSLVRGETAEAVGHMQKALEADPDNATILALLSWVLATTPDDGIRSGGEAYRLAQKACSLGGDRNPLALQSLAAACAEEGRYEEAVRHAERAVQLAAGQGKAGLARRIEMVLDGSFRKGRPFRDAR